MFHLELAHHIGHVYTPRELFSTSTLFIMCSGGTDLQVLRIPQNKTNTIPAMSPSV